ncbi:MAG TPA: hypothetical protein VLK58_21215 [Conexibacter sp.]|nr:hypothetical protein [Conexibacter sp.]
MRARMGRQRVAAAVVGVGLGVAAAAPASAADRAYELVTPAGSTGKALPGTGASTPDGNVVCFDAENALAGAPANGEIAPDGFCSWRTPSGWETEWVTGPDVPELRGGNGSPVFWISPDARRAVFVSDKGIYPDWPGPEAGRSGTPATPSTFLWEGGGMPRWLAPTPEPLEETSTTANRNPLAASDDLRNGLFESGLQLVSEDANTERDLYEWTPSGIRLVSRDPAGAAVGGTAPADSSIAQPGAISRDGSRTFFQHIGNLLGAEPTAQNVYMVEDGEVRHVSPRRGGDVPDRVDFVGASDDGEIVYLQSVERLTPEPKEPGAALYRYDIGSDTLSLVATDPTGVAFLGLSDDGSTVVYRTDGTWDLRILRDGVATTLGTLDVMDVFDFYTVGSLGYSTRALRIAPDGNAVVFSAIGSFDGTPAGTRQVYRWTPEDGVRRLSAPADGAPPSGNANIGNYSVSSGITPRTVGLANTLRNYPLLGRVVTDDGRVFFESQEQLTPKDVNDAIDVYEWDYGSLRLITPGTQTANALYHDSSADGSTVFFTTSARVIPQLDRNTSSDLYAARVDGGFPLPPELQVCDGDRCQGPLTPPTASQPPGSTAFGGPGDVDEPAPPVARHSVASFTARQRSAFARSGRAVLRVRANVSGTVTATASARIGRRTVRVARSSASVRGGATVRLPITLSRQARNVLRSRKKLRVAITISYSNSETSIRRVVMLRG